MNFWEKLFSSDKVGARKDISSKERAKRKS